MPILKPFKALQYDTAVAGRWETLCCPPYDVVSPQEQRILEAQNPYNAIQLERPLGDDPYADAAARLTKWQAEGILRETATPAYYMMQMDFTVAGQPYTLRGFTARVALSPFSEGHILPHEETLSHAKADRLALLEAAQCSFSAIYGLYQDANQTVTTLLTHIADRTPDAHFETRDAVTHRLWRIDDPAHCDTITRALATQQIFIADGHHRYETALNYRQTLRDKGVVVDEHHPANYCMMTLVALDHTGLVVFPTHRVITGAAPDAPEKLLKAMQAVCDTITLPSLSDVPAALHAAEGAIILYHNKVATVLTPRNKQAMLDLLPQQSDAYRSLTVAVLHTMMLAPHFGITAENMAKQENLTYTRDWQEAVSLVDTGAGQCAFLLSPTRVSQIRDVSLAGEKMPQKSTYFYPKLITGLLFNPLSGTLS